MTFTHVGLVQTILALRDVGYSWQKVTNMIAPGVSKIVIWKIANYSYEPRDPILRYKLGLSTLKEVPICEECGKTLTKYHKCKSRPRPPRIAIRLDNPESAVRSIERHMAPENIDQLIELLQEGK